MKISCSDCKNLSHVNMIDMADISCKYVFDIVYDEHECDKANPIYVQSSEDYKRGFLHGYNSCRREVHELLVNIGECDIPEKMKNLN